MTEILKYNALKLSKHFTPITIENGLELCLKGIHKVFNDLFCTDHLKMTLKNQKNLHFWPHFRKFAKKLKMFLISQFFGFDLLLSQLRISTKEDENKLIVKVLYLKQDIKILSNQHNLIQNGVRKGVKLK